MLFDLSYFYAKRNNETFGQTVLQHCICVGQMAKLLSQFKKFEKIPLEEIGLIAALHDIGKLSPVFQYKIGNCTIASSLNKKWSGSNVSNIDKRCGFHSAIGNYFLTKYSKQFLGGSKKYKFIFKSVISRHHGYTTICEDPINNEEYADYKNMKETIDLFIKSIENHFKFKIADICEINKYDLELISGFIHIADCICSMNYSNQHDISGIDFSKDFTKLFQSLQIKETNFKNIFGFSPYSCQLDAIDKIKDYGFYLCQFKTGNGKTEIALMSALNLICSGKCDGIIYALPTQVTSNAIFKRFGDFSDKVFIDSNLKLFYSNSKLLLHYLNKDDGDDSFINTYKNARLLNNTITCTVDQLLFSILNSKFNFAKLSSLWHKVIIIDQIHCYDIYTSLLIKKID